MYDMDHMPLSKLLDNDKLLVPDAPRDYIGASSIGASCARKIWYELKSVPGIPVTSRTVRLFETGKYLEMLVIDLLRARDLEVITILETAICPEAPFFRGHIDGYLPKYKAVLEIKTAKDSSFKTFVKRGLRGWYPIYYSQLQSYMGMMRLKKGVILVVNKDSSDIHEEWVDFDEAHYSELIAKAHKINEAIEPPMRISTTPIWYECKLCRYNKICFNN